ncbi:MAG: hypothetical protein HYR94_15660 [Chloroflexi bacterium]|nr:hypothetical protein [Chloroflexota bacterium]
MSNVTRGFFPLDQQLGVNQRGWSERVEKQVVKLTARESYGEAMKTYQELVGLALEKATAWERSQERGRQLRQACQTAAQQAWALPKSQAIMPGQPLTTEKFGVAMDGGLVYILGEGWKEAKVGCVFSYDQHRKWCPQAKEWVEGVKATQQSYVAHLGEPEPFAKLLSAEAERRGYDQAGQRVCLGDGAKWIWNLSNLCFPTAQEIVDWYHAVEHGWTAGQLGYGAEAAALQRWVKRRKDELWLGHLQTVVDEINALAHQEFREEGYPLGSGMVESGCKQLVTMRMKGPGMPWSRSGAETMLALRAEYLSDRWDQAWQLTLAI